MSPVNIPEAKVTAQTAVTNRICIEFVIVVNQVFKKLTEMFFIFIFSLFVVSQIVAVSYV